MFPVCSTRPTRTLFLCLALCALAPPLAAQIPAPLFLQEIATVNDRAVAIRNSGDGTNRLFILEQQGVIRIYDLDTSTLLTTPFLDIQTLVDDAGNEQGLLGLAFHPSYASNGLFYVNYTRDPGAGDDRTVIARYQVSDADPDIAEPSSATTLLEIEQHSSNHNGGDIHFGPDGLLYIGMGDGGGGGDTGNFSQNTQSLLGKMLRIAVDLESIFADGFESGDTLSWGDSSPVGPDCGLVGNYLIPRDNPFVDDPFTCDEIWHIGLRNPWRFSFDRTTGDLFIADVGQEAWEEIDLQPAASMGGENWGWRCYEGDHEFNTNGCGPAGDYAFPILEFPHGSPDFHCSVTGGYRYRGPAIPGLQGYYAYADYCSRTIWFANDSGGWTTTPWGTASPSSPTTFGEDEAGELYIGTGSGTFYRFEVP